MHGNGRFPSELELDTSAGRDAIILAGPSLRGTIYRSRGRPFYYRLLPTPDEAPLDVRHEVTEWVQQPRRAGLAPIVETRQEPGFFFIRYETGAQRSLAEALSDPDPGLRLAHGARALGALPDWWKTLGAGVLPMPAEIVFSRDGLPSLLPLPNRRLPQVEAVLAEPARGFYLAPEMVCGRDSIASEQSDRYALGVALLSCFFELPRDPGEESLWRVANGTAFAPHRLVTKLPFWLEGLKATREALAASRGLLDRDPETRGGVDPVQLSQHLLEWSRQMDAVRAVTDLRASGYPKEALALLRDILLEQDSFDLLLLAGRIAAEDLKRPLEALDFYEKAMAREPERLEPYEEQFRAVAPLIASGVPGELPLLLGNQSTPVAKLDALMERDFQRLPPERQEEQEEIMARYLLSRGKVASAASFIHPRLFQGSTWTWWDLGMNLRYAEALVGQERLDEAERHLQEIKKKFQQARKNRTISEEEIHRHGMDLTEIEAEILGRRTAGTRGS